MRRWRARIVVVVVVICLSVRTPETQRESEANCVDQIKSTSFIFCFINHIDSIHEIGNFRAPLMGLMLM